MKQLLTHLHPFGWCVVLLLVSTQSWGQECVSGNCINGQGTYTFASGSRYVGEFRDGKRNGQGTFTYASGDQYVGEHRDDTRHSQGTYTFADGRIQAGIWRNGEFVETLEQAKQRALEKARAAMKAEAVAREQAEQAEQEQRRRDRIYNACLIDKSDGVDMSVRSLERAALQICEEIADNPSWLQKLRYD